MKKHAKANPSGVVTWADCEGALAMQEGIPNTSSKFADEGSCAHEIGELVLTTGKSAAEFIGHVAFGNTCDEVMAGHVQSYADTVRQYMVHPTDELLVEVSLDISMITGEPDARGTSDAVVLNFVDQELVCADLKYGAGDKIRAENNRQLMIYALAVLMQYQLVAEWKTVRIVIIQPRAGGVSEWSISSDDLLAFGTDIGIKAQAALALIGNKAEAMKRLTPGAKQCKWCRAKPVCPTAKDFVLGAVQVIPDDATSDELASLLARLPMIEGWCGSVRAEAERRLKAGVPVTGYKLVEGKRGNRAWEDAKAIEAYLKKTVRLTNDQMYDLKLISPTTAEKLAKAGAIGDTQWEKVQTHITRKDGSPTVVEASDPRTAMLPEAAVLQPVTPI